MRNVFIYGVNISTILPISPLWSICVMKRLSDAATYFGPGVCA